MRVTIPGRRADHACAPGVFCTASSNVSLTREPCQVIYPRNAAGSKGAKGFLWGDAYVLRSGETGRAWKVILTE